jgi:hypothetical protein
MLVEIERIGFYEKNSRRSHNGRYNEIKKSIRHQGLDNPLPISRRPGQHITSFIRAVTPA